MIFVSFFWIQIAALILECELLKFIIWRDDKYFR